MSTPTAFARVDGAAGQSGLCVEVTCREGDERWQAPGAAHARRSSTTWCAPGTIDSASQVLRVHIERVPFTYPIYKLELPQPS